MTLLNAIRYPLNAKKGSVLVISLWAIFLLTFFTVTLSNVIMRKLDLSNRQDTGLKSYFAAKAGIETAKALLRDNESKDYDSTSSKWASDESVFKNIRIGEANFSIFYQFKYADSELKAVYGLIDEERKLNINRASQQTLTSFFSLMGIDKPQELATSIVDWRDEDSQTTKDGAENAYYNNLEYPYSARNSDLESTYELLLVKGMTKEKFDIIEEYITVFGDSSVNINTAPKEVLGALGLGTELVAKIIEYRNGPDTLPFTLDDRVFKDKTSIKEDLNSFRALSGGEKEILDTAISDNLIGVKSTYFEIKAEGKTAGDKIGSNIDCVVSRGGEILFWHEE
jgi:general secretion pathway protein K